MKVEGLRFEEAVQALVDGKCDGIKRKNHIEPYRLSGDRFVFGESDQEWVFNVFDALASDWYLINPKKKMVNVVYRADPHSPNSVWYVDEKGYTRQAPRDAEISIKFDMELPEPEPLVFEGEVIDDPFVGFCVIVPKQLVNKKVKIEVLDEPAL